MARKTKSGPISPAEGAVIKAGLAAGETVDAVAARLNRSVGLVQKWADANLPRAGSGAGASPRKDKVEIKHTLKRSLKWQYLREELTEAEVDYFQEQYACYVQQFRDDILPSEEDQIFNMIKLDIATHRNRRDVRVLREELDRLEAEYRSLPAPADREQAEQMRARDIENAMGGIRAAETARDASWLKQHTELRSLQEELKATRSQRVNKDFSMKESFVDVLRRLQDDDYRGAIGTGAEYSRQATEREQNRLAKWHEFEDGKLDQPVLTAETALPEGDEGV